LHPPPLSVFLGISPWHDNIDSKEVEGGRIVKTRICIAFAFVLGIIVGHMKLPVAFAQLRTVKAGRLSTTDLTGWCEGKEVTVELNEIGPGTSGSHYHPGHSFTYVLEGSETYALDGQTQRIVRAGDVLHEAPMELHTVDNLSPVKLLVVRVIEKGKQATVRVP
jgi:quercetin dioxygenase-like cupin family protein